MGGTMIAALITMSVLSGCDGIRWGGGPIASVDACVEQFSEGMPMCEGQTVKGTFVYSAASGEDLRSLLPEDPAAAGVTGSAVLGNGDAARKAFLAEPAGDAPEMLNIDPRRLVKIGYGPAKAEQVIASGGGRIAKTIVLEHAKLERFEADPSQDKTS
jgi:hypothetical protein